MASQQYCRAGGGRKVFKQSLLLFLHLEYLGLKMVEVPMVPRGLGKFNGTRELLLNCDGTRLDIWIYVVSMLQAEEFGSHMGHGTEYMGLVIVVWGLCKQRILLARRYMVLVTWALWFL